MARNTNDPAPKRTCFVVLRDNWRRSGPCWRRGVGQIRLASFDTAEQAEAERARREENVRRRLNPFHCGGELAELTSYPEAVFLDWIQDAGLTPPEKPKKGGRDWAGWWAGLSPAPDLAQRLKVWEAMDRVRFYSVAERPAVPVGYVVLNAIWQYNDDYNYLEFEGGAVQAVYRTRERALEAARKVGDNGDGVVGDWFPSGIDPFDPEAHWQRFVEGNPTYDVIEIELEGLT
jgi:hypothetical protein